MLFFDITEGAVVIFNHDASPVITINDICWGSCIPALALRRVAFALVVGCLSSAPFRLLLAGAT